MEIRREDKVRLHQGVYGLAKLEIIADTLDIDIIEVFCEWLDANNESDKKIKEFKKLMDIKEKLYG